MVNFSSDQKYLDQYGLSLFWDKVRRYIQNQIGGIDGTDIKLYPSGETNPTVTNQIENLLNTIDGSGGITDSIEAILSQYVKNIQHVDPQTTPLKVVVNEGTGDKADFYTVTLEDNGLANTLSDLTSNRVKSLTPKNGGGSVTLGVDKNKGDVTLTINSQELTNKVSGLEATINGMVKSVNKADSGDGTYIKLNIDPTTGDVKLSINDQSLVSELTSIKNNYVKTEDLPTTLPNPHKFTLTYRDKENQNKVVVYDGSSAKDVDFSLYHATTSTTATRVSNSLKVVDADGNVYDYNGGIKVDLSNGINYAANSGKLGDQLPSYYGKQSDITSISQKIAELEALTHVNQITTGDNTSDLVKIGFSNSTGNVVASIDETNLSNKLTSIDNYTINSKKISTSPVLTGSDITLGTSIGDNQNYPITTTLTSSIQKLRQTIAGLGQVVELKGVLTSLPANTSGYKNGDVIIVGNKEYICYESQWYLLGDTTELSQDVSTIKSSYVKSIKGNGVGIVVTPTTSSTGDVTIGVDATSITNTLSNKADKSETIHGYNLQERIEDLNLGTTNRFFRTGGAPNNAPGQNGYVVGLTMALNNDPEYRVQLAYDQSISRLSYRQQLGNKGWMNWKTMALLTDIPTTLPANGGNADTVDGKHASDFAVANHNHDYLPLSGGTMSGGIIVETNSYTYDSPFKRKFDFDTYTGGWARGLLAGSWIKEGATDLSDNFVIGVYGNTQNLAYGYIGSNTTYDDLNHLRIYSDGKIGTPNILPNSNESFDLGSSIKKWRNIYATKVIGDLEGNAKTATTTENISKAPILEATDNEQITVQVGDKTSDPLTVPYATRSAFATDLTGRNEATAEEFTFRPSAGNISIRDDSATIKRIKGNSIVWNQLVYPTKWNTDSVNGTVNMSDDYSEITHISAGNNNIAYIYSSNIVYPSREGHIMYFYAEVSKGYSFYACKTNARDELTFSPIVKVTNNGLHTPVIAFYKNDGSNFEAGEEITIKNIVMFDLTQMFGVGNEPDTVEEFRALFPGNHYEHNPGQLVSMTANGLFTNGFNQWDGKVEVGYIRDETGNVNGNQNYLCTDFIRVIANQEYYINTEQTNGRWGAWYDANKNHIAGIVGYDQVHTAPANAAYVRLTIKTADSGNPDTFCLNLSHTGVENGKYEPYWDATRDLSIIQKYFPNGMRSAGSIYDEISFDETTQKWVAIQRVGNVDLGELKWFASVATTKDNVTNRFFYAQIDGLQLGYGTIMISAPYDETNITPNSIYSKDKTIYCSDNYVGGNSPTAVIIRDSSYNDTASFKSAMSGIMLNYELAEPIITVIEEPVNLSYKVGDFGIEQILSDSFSAPFRADIVYQFNATDRIRENSLNIEKLSKTQNECLLLAGGTMSGQINSQDIKPVEDNTYQLGDSTHKYKNVFSDFFTGNLEGNAKTATDLTGRIEATPEVFTYRPSAGEKSIKDDNAFIRRVKGNSVVWNQLVDGSAYSNTQTRYGLQCSVTSNSREIRVVGTYAGDTSVPDRNWYTVGALTYHTTGIVGHKYLCHISGNKECSLTVYGWCSNSTDIFDSIIKECTSAQQLTMALKLPLVADGTQIDETIIIDIHDLTAMFGVGNEPTTVEEFRALYPDSYYPYNPGELRNLDCSGIKTVGFNQWDEQWERGVYRYWSDGQKSDNPEHLEYIRSANFIRVIPANTYSLNIAAGVDAGVGFYDENNNYLGYASFSYSNNSRLFQVPANCQKITFNTKATTYNNDICINLHHTGWRDGEYEPYKEVTHALPLSQITNGEPLRKAGSVYDEINEAEYIKRVGVVDLGSLTYRKSDNFPNLFISNPFGAAGTDADKIANLFCPKYITMTAYDPWKDIISMGMDTSNQLYIYDPQYTDIEAFKSAMSGIMLNYELAEPIVTPIETPIDFNYYVEDFGTEEALLAEDSAPFSADIVYQFNAVDNIRQNSLNIKKFNDHTHNVQKTETPALEASKSNHSHTAASNGPSISYSNTTGVLTITMAHTHEVPADTTNVINVASQEHTHTTTVKI